MIILYDITNNGITSNKKEAIKYLKMGANKGDPDCKRVLNQLT